MDIIHVEALKLPATIGHYDWEQAILQTVIFDIELFYDCRSGATSDTLTDTLDYCAVVNTLTELTQTKKFKLIEALAESSMQLILGSFPVTKCRLRVSKPNAIPNAHNVSIVIERTQTLEESI